MLHALQMTLLAAFPVLVILGGLKDATSYTIPNWIPLALMAAFAPAALASGAPPASLGWCAAAGFAALICGMGMFAAGWIGGGDAKLLAAAALWLGLPAMTTYLAVTGIAGGALTLGLLALRSTALRPLTVNGPAWFCRLAGQGEGVPYGVAIAVGALAAFPLSPLMTAVAG